MRSIRVYYKQTQRYHKWFFPTVCIVIFSILCVGRIHGSSIGVYRAGSNPGIKDRALLFGVPKSIRSDEFLIISPLAFAQKTAKYPVINTNIGLGQDMSVAIDVPYWEWSTLFKPQNFAYFVLPFTVAFSFHWWLPLLLLLLSSYFLFRIFLPPSKNNLLSATLALSFSFSPFIMWWYAGGTLTSITYVFLLLILTIKLINNSNTLHKFLYSMCMAYLAVCLAMTMYIPFIIASAFAGLFIFIGYIFTQKNPKRFVTKENILYILLAMVLAVIVIATYYTLHKEAIKLILDTVYPGHTKQSVRQLQLSEVFGVFSLFYLQSSEFVKIYKVNQSEVSNFIYTFMYLVVPTLYIIINGIKTKKNDWFLIITSIGITIVTLKLLLPPSSSVIFKYLLLDKAQDVRMLIGLGILNIVFLVAFIRNIKMRQAALPAQISIITVLTTAVIVVAQYWMFRSQYNYINNTSFIYSTLLFLSIVTMVGLLLYKRTIIYGALLLLVISISMSFYINPIYYGVFFEKDKLISEISQQNKVQAGTWAVVDNITLEQYPQMAGVRSITGVMTYPQFEVWKNFPNYSTYQEIINRYAHITLKINSQNINTIILNQPDLYTVNIDPCDSFAQQSIRYLVSNRVENNSCIVEVRSFYFYQQPTYIYEVIRR